MVIFLFKQCWKKTSSHRIHFYQDVNKSLFGGTAWCWYPSLKRHGSKGEYVKMYANKGKIRLEASRWLSHSLRNQSCGATSCGEKVGGGGNHYLGLRESSFVWHLLLKTPGSKKTAANSSKLWKKEVAWLLTQCSLMSISLCLSAGSWRVSEKGHVVYSFRIECYLALATSTKACTASRARQDIVDQRGEKTTRMHCHFFF